jgi:hypothetical protein
MVGPRRLEEPALPPVWIEYLYPDWRTTQYFREWIPGITEHHPEILMADLARSDVLVLADLTKQARTLFPAVPDGPDVASRYVEEHFCAVAALRSYVVLVRSDTASNARLHQGCTPRQP